MKSPPGAMAATGVSVSMIAAGVFFGLLIYGSSPPSQRMFAWIVGAVFALPGLVSLGFLPPLWGRSASPGGEFLPVLPDGRPQHGSDAVQRVAGLLHRTLAGSPYLVLTAPNAVRVEWNTGDLRHWSLLTHSRVQSVFRTTLLEVAPNVFERNDEYQSLDASTGLLKTGGERTWQSGEVIRIERRTDVAVDAAGPQVVVDYSLDTRLVARAVDDALTAAHAVRRRSPMFRYSLMWAAYGGLIALVGLAAAVYAVVTTLR